MVESRAGGQIVDDHPWAWAFGVFLIVILLSFPSILDFGDVSCWAHLKYGCWSLLVVSGAFPGPLVYIVEEGLLE